MTSRPPRSPPPGRPPRSGARGRGSSCFDSGVRPRPRRSSPPAARGPSRGCRGSEARTGGCSPASSPGAHPGQKQAAEEELFPSERQQADDGHHEQQPPLPSNLRAHEAERLGVTGEEPAHSGVAQETEQHGESHQGVRHEQTERRHTHEWHQPEVGLPAFPLRPRMARRHEPQPRRRLATVQAGSPGEAGPTPARPGRPFRGRTRRRRPGQPACGFAR